MDMEHEIPKKLGVLAAHGDEEPPKTLDARYVTDIMYYFDNPEKTPYNLVTPRDRRSRRLPAIPSFVV